jgi:hypothetical protein
MVCQAAAPAVQQSAAPGVLDEHSGPSVLQQLDTIIFDCDGEQGMRCSGVGRTTAAGSSRLGYVKAQITLYQAAIEWLLLGLHCH